MKTCQPKPATDIGAHVEMTNASYTYKLFTVSHMYRERTKCHTWKMYVVSVQHGFKCMLYFAVSTEVNVESLVGYEQTHTKINNIFFKTQGTKKQLHLKKASLKTFFCKVLKKSGS